VTQAERQAGSTFNPFVYSAAIRAGKPASYVINDGPVSLMQNDSMPWEPQNFDEVTGQEHITATLKNAILLIKIKGVNQFKIYFFRIKIGINQEAPSYKIAAIKKLH